MPPGLEELGRVVVEQDRARARVLKDPGVDPSGRARAAEAEDRAGAHGELGGAEERVAGGWLVHHQAHAAAELGEEGGAGAVDRAAAELAGEEQVAGRQRRRLGDPVLGEGEVGPPHHRAAPGRAVEEVVGEGERAPAGDVAGVAGRRLVVPVVDDDARAGLGSAIDDCEELAERGRALRRPQEHVRPEHVGAHVGDALLDDRERGADRHLRVEVPKARHRLRHAVRVGRQVVVDVADHQRPQRPAHAGPQSRPSASPTRCLQVWCAWTWAKAAARISGRSCSTCHAASTMARAVAAGSGPGR